MEILILACVAALFLGKRGTQEPPKKIPTDKQLTAALATWKDGLRNIAKAA